MSYHFRPAIKSEAKPLIGLYSESGCGKTYSSLLLAKGFCSDMSKVGMIETESGRGEVFADDPLVGGYLVLPIRDEFSPKAYGEAISEAGHSDLQVLIVDSASHEWEGAGGVLGMAAKNQEEGRKGPLVWQKPKMDHQREFMLKLMQTPIPLVIVCMRAKYPMKQINKDGKKDWERSDTLEPKQSEDILFEMMVHAWIDPQHAIHITKPKSNEEKGAVMRGVFEDGKPITVDTGKRLKEWASGTIKQQAKAPGVSASNPVDTSTLKKVTSPILDVKARKRENGEVRYYVMALLNANETSFFTTKKEIAEAAKNEKGSNYPCEIEFIITKDGNQIESLSRHEPKQEEDIAF